jgi:hypothetical protein
LDWKDDGDTEKECKAPTSMCVGHHILLKMQLQNWHDCKRWRTSLTFNGHSHLEHTCLVTLYNHSIVSTMTENSAENAESDVSTTTTLL